MVNENITPDDYAAMVDESRFLEGFTEFAELMIQDPKIPKDVKEKWWGFLSKDTILTRSDGNQENWEAANDFAIRKNLHLMSQPEYKNDIEEIVKLDNIRRRFMTQHRRSVGGFERQALMTQIKELRTNRPVSEPSRGVFGRLKGKLGFGSKKEETHAGYS